MNSRTTTSPWAVLGVLQLPLLFVSMDVAVLFNAAPTIARDIEPSAAQLLWILDIYAFVLAAFLLTMGSLADRVGRRRLLIVGAVLFAAASVIAATASSAEQLIAGRALLGLGGAAVMPSTLAIIRDVFHDPMERAKAIGVWSATVTLGVALGPLMAGTLLHYFSWGSVFLINLPAMALLLVAALAVVPESHGHAQPIDWTSSVLSIAAIVATLHGVKDLAAHGWAPLPLASLAVGLLLMAALVFRQRRAAHPMVDPALFSTPGFGSAVTVLVVAMFAMLGSAYLSTQYLQSVLGYTPLKAALLAMIPAAVVAVGAPAAPQIARRAGRPPVLAGALLIAACGFAVNWLAKVDSSPVPILIASGCVALGIVSVATVVTEFALTTAPRERTGAVSGLTETATEFGGALGIALLGSISAFIYRSHVADGLGQDVPAEVATAVERTVGEATVVASNLPQSSGAHVLDIARGAFVDGMHIAATAALAVILLTILLALRMPRTRVSTEGYPPAEGSTSESIRAVSTEGDHP